jgi:uncharacterized protein YndB with AHSA1/START domain
VSTIEKTLVKSPPELWELVDDRELMRRWSAALTGTTGEVNVLEREPGERLTWEAAGADVRIELVLAEKGWGTSVSIRIAGDGVGEGGASTLDGLVDELGSPQRRPFSRA